MHLLVSTDSFSKHFHFLVIFLAPVKMPTSTNLVDKLEGVENFRTWKYRIGVILKENDLAKFIKENVLEPEEVAKEKYKKDMIRAKRIIADYIKDHLIPQVSSKNTPKEMFDALTRMYEGKNIN
jgi:hypothetical protein